MEAADLDPSTEMKPLITLAARVNSARASSPRAPVASGRSRIPKRGPRAGSPQRGHRAVGSASLPSEDVAARRQDSPASLPDAAELPKLLQQYPWEPATTSSTAGSLSVAVPTPEEAQPPTKEMTPAVSNILPASPPHTAPETSPQGQSKSGDIAEINGDIRLKSSVSTGGKAGTKGVLVRTKSVATVQEDTVDEASERKRKSTESDHSRNQAT